MAPELDKLGARLQSALGSDYAVEGKLGSGGFAVVYLVRDVPLKRKLAVKVLSPDVISSHSMLDRFQREAETIAQLSHPHIVPLHFAGHEEDLVYLAMQAVDGGSLADRLVKEKRLSISEAARIFAEIASALSHAHKRGVIHRDIKPENVLIDAESGRSLVTDFGIAQTVGGSSLTATGLVMGTPRYLSPEQVTGDRVDHRADIYALGLLVYEMLTGLEPFSAQTPTAAMMKRLAGPPEPIRNVRPEVPGGLADLIASCLAPDPAQRLNDAADITRTLMAPVAAAGHARAARIRVPSTDAPTRPTRATLSTPHVGRSAELVVFRDWLASAATGNGGVQLVAGASGIGKTRLVTTVAAAAERSGWQVGVGRVYAVETGVPYAVWSDAITGLLHGIDAEARRVLTRGGDWLGTICPAFATAAPAEDPEARDGKARLLWNFTQFVSRLGEKKPLLLILENLHLADSASLELLHFAARQLSKQRVAIIGTYTESELDQQPALRDTEQSLLAIGAAKLLRLDALSQADTEQLVCETFGVDHDSARQLARRVYSWTRGHPFFVEEALKALVERGRLSQKDGRWVGWDVGELDLPRTVRLAVSQRLEGLTTDAHAAAGVAAVIGARVRLPVLREAADLTLDSALVALEELQRAGILVQSAEATADGDTGHEFAHPIIQDVIYDALGAARTRLLHARVARAIEAQLGDKSLANADRLAFHFLRADPEQAGEKTARYLAAAGRDALARHADRAAADYLGAALERATTETDTASLIEDLAQARQRLGDYAGAMTLWERSRTGAVNSGDVTRRARVERRMGLACYWGGKFEDALKHFDDALTSAQEAGDKALRAQLQINRGACWQSLGKPADAERELGVALATAQDLGDDALLTRAHRALLMLHVFVGPPETAHAHGLKALAAAERIGDKTAQWSAHVGLATLAGLTGDGPTTMHHIAIAEPLCEELQSPLFRAYTDEITMQYLFASGDWDAGIAMAERTMAAARALNQRTLLPRVLVAATHFYIARGEHEYSKRLLDEAWEVGVARASKGQSIEVHSQISVYSGLAAYYNVISEYERALELGMQGLAIADQVGYTVWAIYRLIPVTLEAAFSVEDGVRAKPLLERLARDSKRMNHRLGLVWVDAAHGLFARITKDYPTAVRLMRSAITGLDNVPWVYDAARLRRWLGDTLVKMGDREGGIRELRRSHEISAGLGALVEVDRARVMMKELGIRPPTKVGGKRARLTIRESDIAQLVIDRKSNKEIGAALGIATRTVTTHVANIFSKLGVTSRAELADRLRDPSMTLDAPERVGGTELT